MPNLSRTALANHYSWLLGSLRQGIFKIDSSRRHKPFLTTPHTLTSIQITYDARSRLRHCRQESHIILQTYLQPSRCLTSGVSGQNFVFIDERVAVCPLSRNVRPTTCDPVYDCLKGNSLCGSIRRSPLQETMQGEQFFGLFADRYSTEQMKKRTVLRLLPLHLRHLSQDGASSTMRKLKTATS
jgi:hypothetical protein